MTVTEEAAPAEEGQLEIEEPAEPVPRKATAPRKAAKPKAEPEPAVNGAGQGAAGGGAGYEPPTVITPKQAEPAEHPVYGTKKTYTYQPRDGSEPLVFPHISNARPTAKFFYKNRRKDEMHQAFAWMDLCEIPDAIGERLFDLPDEEQSTVIREWFAGLSLSPQGVAPPGEF